MVGILPLALLILFGVWFFGFLRGGLEGTPVHRPVFWVLDLFRNADPDQWAALLLGVAVASGFGGPEIAPSGKDPSTEAAASPA